MIEPEAAFCDLQDNMRLAEDSIKHLVSHVLENCSEDIELFARFVDKGLMSRLETAVKEEFARVTYSDAVKIIDDSKQKFEFDLSFGKALQAEHERYLTEKHFKKPVIVHDYPLETSPFYMRVNDDGATTAGMDVLLPLVGEIIGGSQREERLEVLLSRMDRLGLKREDYWWYIDSRKFGSVPHSGFGLGFERMMMFVTGISNIRDVIPFPRTPKNIEF
jgi:asparaginyl-tRNA synthetase